LPLLIGRHILAFGVTKLPDFVALNPLAWEIPQGFVLIFRACLIFDDDVTSCAYTATQGFSGSTDVAPGTVTVVGRNGNPNGVYIATYNSAGGFADRGFHLFISC